MEHNLRYISAREYRAWIVLAIILVLVTAFASVYYSHKRQVDRDYGVAHVVERSVYEYFSGLVATLVSFSSIQQLQTAGERSNIESYAKSILARNKFASALSRYEKVLESESETFGDEMSEFGIYQFSINEIADDGSLVAAAARDLYYPLKNIYPFGPTAVRFIGLDLASIANMSEAMEDALVFNDISVSMLDLPTQSRQKLTLLHPTYFGREVPDEITQRNKQHDGGYLLDVDPEAIVSAILEIQEHLSVSLIYRNNGGETSGNSNFTVLADYNYSAVEPRYLTSLFPGINYTFHPFRNDDRVEMSLKSANGVAYATVKNTVGVSVATLFFYALIMYLVLQKRIAESKRKNGLKELERQKEMALITLGSISEAVITTDIEGKITFANQASAELLRMSDAELKGKPLCSIVQFDCRLQTPDNDGSEHFLENALRKRKSIKLPELGLLDNDTNVTQVDSVLSALREKCSGAFHGSVLVMRDVSAERELSRELEYFATHDSLTNISNRYYFEQNLRKLVDASRDNGEQHAICYIDLDQFKIVNDTCGHSAGDKLLIQVTESLKNIIRKQDTLARLGGDEFGLLIHDCDEVNAEAVARSVYQFFQTCYFQHNENMFAVRASIGFVHISGQHATVEDVMAAADLACYSAKDRGRNELHIYSHSSDDTDDRKDEMLLLPKLQKALRYDNFRLFVQPIAGLGHNATQEHERFEILLRLIEDDGQIITPYQLILAAERYDLMREIDRWVIKNSMEKIALICSASESQRLRFSINLSGQSTVDADLPDFISEQLARTGVHPDCLCFEITETSAIANMQHALKLVDYLHDLGCTIALDDFGSGVSSFGYLKTLPVDYLKIDGQFIQDIHNNKVDREMVKCMQAVAGLLGIFTVAEFVECAEIVNELESLNVDFAQGYFYAKPFPFDTLLEQWKVPFVKAA